jgi:hypothetical protein
MQGNTHSRFMQFELKFRNLIDVLFGIDLLLIEDISS